MVYLLSHSQNSNSGLLPVDPISIKNWTAVFPEQCETEHAYNWCQRSIPAKDSVIHVLPVKGRI